jgi:hypothetical protein
MIRILMWLFHGGSALACAAAGLRPGAMRRAAARAARRMERERTRWGNALALLLRAGVAAGRGEHEVARGLLTDAAGRLDAVGMGSYAAAARRRLGTLLGGDEGRALVEQADAWMGGQGVKDPIRMTALHAPGFVGC